MKLIRSDYMTAASLSIAALTGHLPFDKEVGVASVDAIGTKENQSTGQYATWLREQVRAGLAYGHTLSQKSNYMEFVQAFKQDWKKKHDTVGLKLVRLCHNALDTVTHGRIPMADDPSYAKAYKEQHENQRAA